MGRFSCKSQGKKNFLSLAFLKSRGHRPRPLGHSGHAGGLLPSCPSQADRPPWAGLPLCKAAIPMSKCLVVQSGCWSPCCEAQTAASRTGDKEERFPPQKGTPWKLHIPLPLTYQILGPSDWPHSAAGEMGRGSGHCGWLSVQQNERSLLLRKRGGSGHGAQSTVGHTFSCPESVVPAFRGGGCPAPSSPLSAPAQGLPAVPPAPSLFPPGQH